MNAKRGLNAYQSNQTRTRAEVASPYRLVVIMYENLIDNLSKAAGAIERKDMALRGESIGKCMDILGALSGALDHEIGGEMSQNLAQIYQYCNTRLLEATRTNSAEPIDEVMDLMTRIKGSWDQIGGQLNGGE
ncbi:flagellar export chaperone FliS [Endozoicomonas lisbonensis]|uniref:Flagellar secretion chaperone FliS n=1 Tax=Endozoicomonas lisbonensis TaxID=3120522 RepID=A0ABV2SBI4_9GAMM